MKNILREILIIGAIVGIVYISFNILSHWRYIAVESTRTIAIDEKMKAAQEFEPNPEKREEKRKEVESWMVDMTEERYSGQEKFNKNAK